VKNPPKTLLSRRHFMKRALGTAAATMLLSHSSQAMLRGSFQVVTTSPNIFTTVLAVTPVQTPAGTGAGSRQIFVSSSTGSDTTGNGTESSPFATLVHAATFVRNNSSDQLFLKCGDTFTNDQPMPASSGRFEQAGNPVTIVSGTIPTGATISGPILISSYGTGARPICQYSIGANPGGFLGRFINSETATDAINICIIGINVYSFTRDPGNSSYVGATTAAADSSGAFAMQWDTGGALFDGLILVEDCIINFFPNGMDVQGPTTGTSPSVSATLMPNCIFALRRNIITNAYDGSGSHSQGVGATQGIGTLYDIENFWDHNGWNENAGLLATTPGTGATIFSRNLYDGNQGITQQGTVTRVSQGSIHARGASNTHFRSGCNISDGLFFKNGVGGVDLGENIGTDSQSADINNTTPGPNLVQRTVVLESTGIAASNAQAAQPGGSGFFLANIENTTLNNCIVANCDQTSANSQAINWLPSGDGNTVSGNVVTDLIAFGINTAFTSTSQSSQVNVSSATNFVDLTGSNTGSSPEPFPHPKPTASGATSLLDDYWASLGNTIENPGGVDFLMACAARPAGTFNRAISAYGVLDFIQDGFGVSYRS
jgi:hypothetical protein